MPAEIKDRFFTPLANYRGEQGLPIVLDNYKKQIQNFSQWKENPQAVFPNSVESRNHYDNLLGYLNDQYGERVRNSGLAISEAVTTKPDVELAREIIYGIETGPWNPSMKVHSDQVGVYSRVIAEIINEQRLGDKIDPNRMEVKGMLHDIGRATTHHPVAHAFAGREILKAIGVSADIRTSNLSDNEAGIGPYISYISPENWGIIDSEEGQIDQLVANLPLEEVIVALADMGKIDIDNVKFICDPIEGLVPSAIRRLSTNTFTPNVGKLITLASSKKSTRTEAQAILDEAGLDKQAIHQMAMYFGWAGALKRRVENLGVKFDGEDGVVKEAQKAYETMVASRSF